MSSSTNLATNVPALSTEPLTHVPPTSSTEDPVPSPPPSTPPSTTDAGAAKPATEVPPVSVTVAQSTDPLDKTPTLVDSVPDPVPAEVQLPAESTPAEKTADAMDLTDDQDDVEPVTSGEVLVDGVPGASTCPPGMSYYFLVFFFSSHHSFLIRHVAHSHVSVFPNMVLLI